jgi:hypothetical protein
LRRQGIEPHRQRVELALPVAAVAVEPQRGDEDRSGIEPAAADPTAAVLGHQPGAHQHLDVPRYRLQRNVERLCQFSDEQVLPIQPVEDCSPHRVGKRSEHLVEGLVVGFVSIHDRWSTELVG